MAFTKYALDYLKPKDKSYMVLDDSGLYIEVYPNGKKFWRLRFTHDGVQKKVSLGEYPSVGLKEARLAAVIKREEIVNKKHSTNRSFVSWEEEWFKARVEPTRAPKTIEVIKGRLDVHIIPSLGNIALSEITVRDISSFVDKLEKSDRGETGRRCLGIIGQVIRYAASHGENVIDPTPSIREMLAPRRVEHYSSITDKDGISVLMSRAYDYRHTMSRLGLLFTAYTFCRHSEVREAKWSEINMEDRIWRIPAERMKARRPHIVPLSNQALEILTQARGLVMGDSAYVFPSSRSFSQPISESAMPKLLRMMGYSTGRMTVHGFRSIASTILNESGFWSVDAIEKQLAHIEMNSVRAAYNYAQLLPERTLMMQWYADKLDSLRTGQPSPPKPQLVEPAISDGKSD